jgi:tetratricopeptide (TPR) repeat protein
MKRQLLAMMITLLLGVGAASAEPGDTVACGGIVLDRQGQNPNEAIAACSRLLAQAGTGSSWVDRWERADAYSNRGYAYYKKGDAERAIADYDEAIRLRPDNATLYENRAKAWSAKGDAEHARADYAKARELEAK